MSAYTAILTGDPLCEFNFYFIFLKYFREGKREREREGGETSMCGCLLSTLYWGHGLQPKHVPWLGIQLTTLWFAGPHSIHWATPARALMRILKISSLNTVYSSCGQGPHFKLSVKLCWAVVSKGEVCVFWRETRLVSNLALSLTKLSWMWDESPHPPEPFFSSVFSLLT